MKFQYLDIGNHRTNPATGRRYPVAERLDQVFAAAQTVEEYGFDIFAIGEHHVDVMTASAIGPELGALAHATSRIRLLPAVSILGLHDPVRIAEDYATIDQLSKGRLEFALGSGNFADTFGLFGLSAEDAPRLLNEKYELLRRLWREEQVDWSGDFRPPLSKATILPRPWAGAPRVWHASVKSTNSVELAAKWGDPLLNANDLQKDDLIRLYRQRWEEYGHDPRFAYLGLGSYGTVIADTPQKAKELFVSSLERIRSKDFTFANIKTSDDVDEAIAKGVVLVGTAEQVIEKILGYYAEFRHDLQSVQPAENLAFDAQLDTIRRFGSEVIPVLRKEAPTTLFSEGDPYAGRPAYAGAWEPDAAAKVAAGLRLPDPGRPEAS